MQVTAHSQLQAGTVLVLPRSVLATLPVGKEGLSAWEGRRKPQHQEGELAWRQGAKSSSRLKHGAVASGEARLRLSDMVIYQVRS